MVQNKGKGSSWLSEHRQELCIILLVFVIGGVVGFVYEELFYRINDYIEEGMWHWLKRGHTFGPWIPIYGFGGVFIYLATRKLRKKPLLVFLISGVVCGALEYVTGLVVYQCFHTRFWDYNVEIWNWGNINGYICARSVLFFALAGLMLQYVIYPILKKVAEWLRPGALTAISVTLASVSLADMIINAIRDAFFLG